MENGLKICGVLAAIAAALFGTSKLIEKAKDAYAKSEAERKEREAERQEQIEVFNSCKSSFKKSASDTRISNVTLNNDKITNVVNKSYLYDKLKGYKTRALNCSYDESHTYAEYVDLYSDLYNMLKDETTTSDSIDAKILSLQKEDNEIHEIMENKRKKSEEAEAHRRELEKIKAEKDAQLEIYEAKLEAEKAKFKTVCETMNGNGNKSVNHTLNIKTNVED